MRPLPVFCFGFLVMAGRLLGESNLIVDRNPPPVFARSIAGLLTRYDEVKAGKTAFPAGNHEGIVLLTETIQFRDVDGTRYRVLHQIYQAVEASAVQKLGNSVYTFDRDRESIFLVEASTILPDGQRQPVTEKGAFIQTPQHEAENSLYTSQAQLSLIFPSIAPASATEAIVLIRENTPVMPGEFCAQFSFYASWPVFLQRLVVDLPDPDWSRVHVLLAGSGIGEPLTQAAGQDRTRKTWIQRLAPMCPWEENGPAVEFRAPTLWLSTLNGWDEVARWFYRLESERSELGPELTAEVAKLTANLREPGQIVDKLCSVVANDVRYTGLEFGLAGFQPAPCRDVWARRYGDCKDKANLLRAMLAQKGIRSYVVLLNTGPLGLIERGSPSWQQFNHAILAVEDGPGRYRFCDPTIKYLPAGVLGAADRARDLLLVQDGHAQWVRAEDASSGENRISAELKLGPDGELSGWMTFAAAESAAAGFADYYNSLEKDDRLRAVQHAMEKFVPGATVADIDYPPAVGSVTKIQLRAFLRRPARSSGGETINFPYPAEWLPQVTTTGERRFPYAMARQEESIDIRFSLPEGWSPVALPAAFNAPMDAADFAASWTATDGALLAQLHWAPRKSGILPSEYAAFQRAVRALTAWLAQPVVVSPKTDHSAAAVTVQPAQNLADFPILPTGEGQLRLVDEKFPAGKDDERRRAALAQVLQWFPQDAETVFTAQVELLQLDINRLGPRAFASQIAALLASHGRDVSLAARSWAEFLEATAQWQADKSRSALQRLRAMAADESLPRFRRGMAALTAAQCLAESNPGAAADFLRPYCDLDSASQNESECLVALGWTQTADKRKLIRFLDQLPGRHPADPDAIMVKVVGTIAVRSAQLTPAARDVALDAFSHALAPSERFPKACQAFAQFRRGIEADAARRHFSEELRGWLQVHPPKGWTNSPLKEYPDAATAIRIIEESNDAKHAPKLEEATLQLVVFHEPDFADLAKYTFWAIWWLDRDHSEDELLERLGSLTLALPPEGSENVVECWASYAKALARRSNGQRAAELDEKILNCSAARDYQKVDAGGERAQIELRTGHVDEALAWFRKIEPTHTTSKSGVDYLYTALLVELERGNFDRGLEIVAHIRDQQPSFIKAAVNSAMLEPLLRAGEKPEALKRYWQRRAKWRPQWDQILSSAGLTPAPLNEPPVGIDWHAHSDQVAKAVADRDAKTYLRLLNQIARVSQWVPAASFAIEEYIHACDPFPAELRRSLRECALVMVTGWEPVDPQFDDNATAWEAAVILALERKAEAGAKARALYEKIGPDTSAGEAVLRIWAIASRGTADEPAAIEALTRLCVEDRALANRMSVVRVLSDSLFNREDTFANLKLLERETARNGFDPTSDNGKALLVRLEALRQRHSSASALTKIVSDWKTEHGRDWFERVGPASLDDPRCAGIKEPFASTTAGFTEAERVKVALLYALDDRQETGLREKAFAEAVSRMASATNDIERCTSLCLALAENPQLSPDLRRNLLTRAIFFTAAFRRPDLLAACTKEDVFTLFEPDFRSSVTTILEALKLLADGSPQPGPAAFHLLTQAPVDGLRNLIVLHLLCEMAINGQAGAAAELVAQAGAVTVSRSLDQSSAGVRLQWTRRTRIAAELAPLVESLTKALAQIPAASGVPDERIRNRLRIGSRSDLTAAESTILASLWLRSARTVTPEEIAAVLDSLVGAHVEHILPVDFGPEVFEAVLGLKSDDAVKALILNSAFSLCDIDAPYIPSRIDPLLQRFLASPEAAKQPETTRRVVMFRARIALRTSKEERPDALFGTLATSKIPVRNLQLMQLRFHHSRGNWPECDSIVAALDPDTAKAPAILTMVRDSLERTQRASEVSLFVEAAQGSVRGDLATMWFDPADLRASNSPRAFVETDGLEQLIPDDWYERALASCRDARFNAELRYLRAKVHRNWAETLRACNDFLALCPETYSYFFYRAEANRALGRNDEAKKDLQVFLTYSLDNVQYQQALQMQKDLGGRLSEHPQKGGSG